MKWVTFVLLWIVAVVVAVCLLRRAWRGQPVVLSGRWSPRIVRLVVIVLVVLGLGESEQSPGLQAAPAKLPDRNEDDQLPKSFQPHMVQGWLYVQQSESRYPAARLALARGLAGDPLSDAESKEALVYVDLLSGKAGEIAKADLQAMLRKKDPPAVAGKDLLLALDQLEAVGRYDHWANAYLWRRSASATFDSPERRAELYARFRRHARVTDALIRATAEVRPPMQSPRAWMSKAGPREEDMPAIRAYQKSMADVKAAAAAAMPTTDEGTWKRDGVMRVRPAAAMTLVRGDRARELPADAFTRVGRLDLLRTTDAVDVEVDGLGTLKLPAEKTLSVFELPALLDDAAKKKLDAWVLSALKDNSEDAADDLERCLAVSHHAIRAGLKELPGSKGAPRMRLVLSLFDDAVMSALK